MRLERCSQHCTLASGRYTEHDTVSHCANWVTLTAIATALQSLPHKRGIIRTTRHWHTLGTPMAHTNGNVCCLGGIELNTHVHPRHARGPPLPCWRWSTGHAWMDLNSCLQHAPSYPHMLAPAISSGAVQQCITRQSNLAGSW